MPDDLAVEVAALRVLVQRLAFVVAQQDVDMFDYIRSSVDKVELPPGFTDPRGAALVLGRVATIMADLKPYKLPRSS